jgi:hypothetical protein
MPLFLTPDFGSLRPFWLAAALALATAIIANLDIANLPIGNFLGYRALYPFLAAAFSGAMVGHLWAQPRLRASAFAPMLGAAVGIAIMVPCKQNPTVQSDAVAGILLLATIAPYCGPRPDPDELWRFWLRLAIATVFGLTAILVCGGGAALWLFSVKQLFGLDIPPDSYLHVWASAAVAVGPIFALSVLGRRGHADRADQDPGQDPDPRTGTAGRAILSLLRYAVIPLILVYAAILHFYALKIGLSGQLPDGQIGWLVLAFGLAGTAAYLVGLPWRDTDARVLRMFFKGWFGLCIVPAILLAVGLGWRIAHYGVTAPRYYLGLYGLWLGGTAVFMLLRRKGDDPRGMVAAMGALLILTNLGPWSSVAVSARSQAAHLRDVLAQACETPGAAPLLETDWACVPPEGAARDRARSAFLALKEIDALDTLRPMFQQGGSAPAAGMANPLRERLEAALGLDAATAPKDEATPEG